jgi:hypothetical protein
MLSGWSVIGMERRSIDRVTQPYYNETAR